MNTNTNRTSLRLELSKLQLDKEKLARDRWWKEDQLVHQRLTWLLSAHVILGTGYAWLKYRIAELIYGSSQNTSPSTIHVSWLDQPGVNEVYIAQLAKLSNVLAIIGSVVSVLALVGMSAAWTAQYLLQRQYPEFRLGVSAGTTMFGHLAALSVPFVCIAGWIFSTLYLA